MIETGIDAENEKHLEWFDHTDLPRLITLLKREHDKNYHKNVSEKECEICALLKKWGFK
jgi:hypothetical protein